MLHRIITNNILIAKNDCTKNLIEILSNHDFYKPLFLVDRGFHDTKLWSDYEKKFKKRLKFQR